MTRTEISLQTIVLYVQVAATLAYSYSCPSAWKLANTSCYQLWRWDQRKSWTEAENFCQLEGGHLASIATAAENAVVMGLLSQGRAWIGVHEPGRENDRVWSDGLPVTYANWGDGEPNTKTNKQDCVVTNSTGYWFDVRCDSTKRYVCEINATLLTTAALPTTPQTTTLLATSKNSSSSNATTVPVYQATTSQAAKTVLSTTVPKTTAATIATRSIVSTSTAAFTVTTAAATTPPKPSTDLTGVALITSPDIQTGKTDAPTTHVTDTPTTAAKPTGPHSSTGSSAQGMSEVSQTPSAQETNKSSRSIVIGAAGGGMCALLILIIIVSVVYCRYRRKSDVSNSNLRTGSCTSRTEENPYYSDAEQKRRDKPSRGDDSENGNAYAMTEFGFNTHVKEQRMVATGRGKSTEKSSSLEQIEYQNVDVRVTDNDQKNGSGGHTVPCQSSNEVQTVDEAGYSTPILGFKKLRAAVYWEPAATEEQLYAQIERHNFPQISRQNISSKQYVASGEFGTVDKALWQPAHLQPHDSSVVVAVKTLKSETEEDRVRFLREAAILGQFHHKNVVTLYGVVTTGSPLMIVLEYMKNGDLKHYLVEQRPSERLSEQSSSRLQRVLLRMCRDIASGLEYLTGKCFVHRDLAARNILLGRENTCKIGDFGLARDLADETYYVTRGGKIPIRWSAPETWNYRKYSSASDVWSYGIVLFEVWSLGCRPFGVTTNEEIMSLTDEGYRLPPPPGCPRPLYHLMIDCWDPDYRQRLKCGDVVKRLSVPDRQILRNSQTEEAVTGSLGDQLSTSINSYQDLQMKYLKT